MIKHKMRDVLFNILRIGLHAKSNMRNLEILENVLEQLQTSDISQMNFYAEKEIRSKK
jgi:hypothetical protein